MIKKKILKAHCLYLISFIASCAQVPKPARLKQSSEMDNLNDQQGIEAANLLRSNGNLSWRQLEEEGIRALQEGKLKVLKPGQQTQYPTGGR